MSNAFPILNGLEQADALSPLLFKSTLKYATGKFQLN